MSLLHRNIYVAPSDLGGRGVFAAEQIKKDDVIEVCPVIVLAPGQTSTLDKTTLYDYYFLWEDADSGLETCAIALGYGSLYNHAAPSNADYVMDFEHKTIDIFCVRDIEPGEEITINYHGDPNNESPPWFMTDNKIRKK
ncbi:MAG: SET domain-containing protein-lysine N-methyltransferase [Saprospiraceae bacterium]|nr:SET domain-containing protein-lysine N-methyltransferase [Saprospiraceae bacterium]MBP7699906.1 SET domain-containing protein-lysine N-methyltransferase [Saprospiraceae bacterium]